MARYTKQIGDTEWEITHVPSGRIVVRCLTCYVVGKHGGRIAHTKRGPMSPEDAGEFIRGHVCEITTMDEARAVARDRVEVSRANKARMQELARLANL